MMTWDKICIICSSPAEFSMFEKIPPFLHAGSREHVQWQTPINELIYNTTGLTILPEDGLPQSICAICISYLKHAATFRNRALDNFKNLRAIQIICDAEQKSSMSEDKMQIKTEIIEDEIVKKIKPILCVNSEGVMHIKKKRLKKAWKSPLLKPPSAQEITQELRFLCIKLGVNNPCLPVNNSKFTPKYSDKELTSSNEEVDPDPERGSATAGECLFSYTEKHFQEDDVMKLNELGNAIGVKEPESCFERKCRACHARYLFDDTFNEHLNICPEYRILLLIEELNLLLEIRRKKAVSPHEYIRRVIFAVRKICDWLAGNYDQVIPLPTCLPKNRIARLRSEGDGCHNELMNSKQNDSKKNSTDNEDNKSSRKDSPLAIKEIEKIAVLPKIDFKNILSNIGLNAQQHEDTQRQRLISQNGYVANCLPCQLNFATISEFEIHNMLAHNSKKTLNTN